MSNTTYANLLDTHLDVYECTSTFKKRHYLHELKMDIYLTVYYDTGKKPTKRENNIDYCYPTTVFYCKQFHDKDTI